MGGMVFSGPAHVAAEPFVPLRVRAPQWRATALNMMWHLYFFKFSPFQLGNILVSFFFLQIVVVNSFVNFPNVRICFYKPRPTNAALKLYSPAVTVCHNMQVSESTSNHPTICTFHNRFGDLWELKKYHERERERDLWLVNLVYWRTGLNWIIYFWLRGRLQHCLSALS